MLKNFLKIVNTPTLKVLINYNIFFKPYKKSEPENIEPGLRTQIALEIVKSEINFMKQLEIIQKYYAKPLKATLDAGQ